MICELREYAAARGWPPCGGGYHNHHIFPKDWIRKNKKAKALVEEVYPHIFIAEVCAVHNAECKLADNPEARSILLRNRITTYGYEYVEGALNEIRATYKLDHPEWRLEALLAR